jgi:putative phage-type endonuclease
MKSNITLIPTAGMPREDWLQFRKKGIGASEVGAVMGLSPYKSSIELFYDKIGESLGYTVENLAMFLGTEQESFVAMLWEHWDPVDGTVDTMVANYRAGRKVRRCKRVNAYATNSKYPWLFVSLDREINKFDARGNGALELKTVGGWESDKWESGIPPSNIVQVTTQTLVCEYLFGELAQLKDNRDFFVFPFEHNESIAESILATTKAFWDRVEKARVIVTRRFEAQRNMNYRAVDELNAELQAVEPEPDGSDAFNAFLKEKYKIAIPGEQAGSLEDLANAQAHKEAKDRIKLIESEKQLYENRLKNVIRDGADALDFGVNGRVTWKTDARGIRRFLNNVK